MGRTLRPKEARCYYEVQRENGYSNLAQTRYTLKLHHNVPSHVQYKYNAPVNRKAQFAASINTVSISDIAVLLHLCNCNCNCRLDVLYKSMCTQYCRSSYTTYYFAAQPLTKTLRLYPEQSDKKIKNPAWTPATLQRRKSERSELSSWMAVRTCSCGKKIHKLLEAWCRRFVWKRHSVNSGCEFCAVYCMQKVGVTCQVFWLGIEYGLSGCEVVEADMRSVCLCVGCVFSWGRARAGPRQVMCGLLLGERSCFLKMYWELWGGIYCTVLYRNWSREWRGVVRNWTGRVLIGWGTVVWRYMLDLVCCDVVVLSLDWSRCRWRMLGVGKWVWCLFSIFTDRPDVRAGCGECKNRKKCAPEQCLGHGHACIWWPWKVWRSDVRLEMRMQFMTQWNTHCTCTFTVLVNDVDICLQ